MPTYGVVDIFSMCLALRRVQQIEREVSEAEEASAACAQGSESLLYTISEQNVWVHLIITMIKWIRTSRLSIKNSLSLGSSSPSAADARLRGQGLGCSV